MMRIDLGAAGSYCDRRSRRSFLQLGVAGLASVGLPRLLAARETSAASGLGGRPASVILIWLDGGPSHMDLYDLKPEAPEQYRGIWKPIPTVVPGFDIGELFPKQARHTDKFSMVRSLHHDSGDHFTGAHHILTAKGLGVSGANTTPKFPSLGSIAARELGPRKPGVPAYASVPVASSVGLNPGYFGGNLLGMQYDPYQPGGDPNAENYTVQDLNLLPGLSIDRLEDRRSLRDRLDAACRARDAISAAREVDRFSEQAFDFVTGPDARRAFDINQEDPRTRDRYGRHPWSQSMLLARRLVESGVTFVTVHLGGWDHHWDLQKGMETLLPIVDSGVSALFEDLHQRGLLDSTLVMLTGEFSRTPKMNDGGNGGPPLSMGTPGRDHWGHAMFCLMGGGGVQGGRVVGSTDRLGMFPHDRPVTPSNLHATVYRVLGIDPHLQLFDQLNRPISVLDDPEPITELF
ncbi:DUF1501 domain-containing protein [Tautonia sociabilis]|uniref:DUF1501 domain-containing protein n=1 Tax=Tautonia sociabilis TaxID=2080755 RepID=A0A432MP84_9BACT|nr:DUF1501 domain-containing protein [Tautonia sociabilis]RUL89130.1 DUF1501 domain-containing protein [Tautonia sociabilis]